jgi:integrase
MKMKAQHIVPLSEQTVAILEKIRKFSPNEGLLFPCRTDASKSISDNTLSKVFRDQEYRGKATPHGIRATASTILNENGFKPDVIERQLAHCERNKIRASYNHAQYLPGRKEMMLWWGEYVGKRVGESL